MAVTLGNTSSGSGNTSSLVWSHTVGGGANKELRIGISVADGFTITTVTFGATTATLIRSEKNAAGPMVEIWEVPDPSGTADITVTVSGMARVGGMGADFSGADPSGTVDDAGSNADAQTSVSNSPSNVVGDDFVFDVIGVGSNQNPTAGANQTEFGQFGTSSVSGEASHQDGTDGAAMSWTFSSDDVAHAACRIPASTGAAPLRRIMVV